MRGRRIISLIKVISSDSSPVLSSIPLISFTLEQWGQREESTDRQIPQSDRQTDRQMDRQTDRQTDTPE
jgi:hypothetical protein